VFNDVHGPYNEARLTNLVLDIYQDLLGPNDYIVINGDLIDFYTINSYGNKSPLIQETLQSEIEWGYNFFTDLRKRFPTQKIVYIFGNHEDRLDRLLINAPHFWNMFNLESMLGLEERSIEWIPYNDPWDVPTVNLRIRHSPPSYSVNGARTSLLKSLHNYIYACSHRKDYACVTTDDDRILECWFNGWLGDLNQFDKTIWKFMRGNKSWQHTAGLLNVYDGSFWFDQMKFENYTTIFNGFRYEG
jgi:hypothetical protein